MTTHIICDYLHFVKCKYGGFIMCKLLQEGFELLNDKDKINFVFDQVGFDDDKEYSEIWDFVGWLFDPVWRAGGFSYCNFYMEKAIDEEYNFCQILQAFEERGYTASYYKQLNIGEVFAFLCQCVLEDEINEFVDEDFFQDAKENFLYSLYAIGEEYGLENLKKVCSQRAEKAGFKDHDEVWA